MPTPQIKGTVEPYLLSEMEPVPGHTSQFNLRNYRHTGVSWPVQEFDGIFQMYRHAIVSRNLGRPFAGGDLLIVKYHTANVITTLVALDEDTPLLWNGEHHRIFKGNPTDRILLVLPNSLRPDLVESN